MSSVSLADSIVSCARTAFTTGRTKEIEWRLTQLQQLHKMLVEHEADFIEAEAKDLRKPAFETVLTELATTRSEAAHAINKLRGWMKPTYPSKGLSQMLDSVYIKTEPYGVVLIIGPWNYPSSLLFIPLVGAIAAGNCAVLKPSESVPHVADLCEKLVPQYLDKECFHVYKGSVPETTALLEQRFDYIFFTGNPTVGRIIMQAAAKHLTPVTLELGGKSPAYVHKDSDVNIVAARIAWGRQLNGGQTCVSPDYILCDPEVRDAFLKAYMKVIRERFGEDPQKSKDLTRIVNGRHLNRLKGILEKTPQEKIVMGGTVDEKDLYVAPTLIKDCSMEDAVMSEEIFGPILPVVTVKDEKEAVAIINKRDKALALYVFSKNKAVVDYVLHNTSSGGVTVNDTVLHQSTTNLPFGGVGVSGMGGYHGKFSFDTFSHHRPICYRAQNMESLLSVRYPPYTDSKLKQSKYLIEEKPGSYCTVQ